VAVVELDVDIPGPHGFRVGEHPRREEVASRIDGQPVGDRIGTRQQGVAGLGTLTLVGVVDVVSGIRGTIFGERGREGSGGPYRNDVLDLQRKRLVMERAVVIDLDGEHVWRAARRLGNLIVGGIPTDYPGDGVDRDPRRYTCPDERIRNVELTLVLELNVKDLGPLVLHP